MAIHRAVEAACIGRDPGPDVHLREGELYDDQDPVIAEMVKRYPRFFKPAAAV